jgi:hypothetical protein
MQFSAFKSSGDSPSFRFIANRRSTRLILPLLLTLLCGANLSAQQPGGSAELDKQTLHTLLQRIDQLEARVSQLEAEKQAAGIGAASIAPATASTAIVQRNSFVGINPANVQGVGTVQAPAPAPTAPSNVPEAGQSQSENSMSERMDFGRTLLRIRGFGDVSLHGDTGKGDTTSFTLGQLNLFVTSDISDKFKFLSEIVFEGGPDNIYGVTRGTANLITIDVERYFLQYSHNDYLNLAAGRFHTGIGYYNTAYHHSTWFQTTTDRPFLFNFEDRGGILPIHMVGVSASGLIPSGRLGLHYVAEVGNNRESRNPVADEPVQNIVDDQNHKAFNIALFARPEAVRGLQTGFSVYRSVLAPVNAARVGETIVAVHTVLARPRYEWLNEAMMIRHSVIGGSKVYNTPGFYTQVSRQFSYFRPYFRYQYINAAATEPIFPDIGRRHGPSAGIRYDVDEFVALKFQYDYTFLRQQDGINALTVQLGFTF